MLHEIMPAIAHSGVVSGPYRRRTLARRFLEFYADGDRRAKAGFPALPVCELRRLSRLACGKKEATVK